MWNKASKAKKIDETSTPNQIVVESSASHDEVENNLQLALVQTPDEEHESDNNVGNLTPIVEDDLSTDEDDEATQADLQALKHDPGKRIPISRYDVNDQDRVRRRYIEMGPCQPKKHKFKVTVKSGKDRRFYPGWFAEFPWIEYSVEKDAAFCFVCYLFKDKTKCPGGDSFVKDGFRNWNLKQRLRLTWTLKCLRFLLHQGLAFRGHDESEDSLNKGNFLELLNWLAGNFEEVNKVVLNNAPQNCRMIHHDIQHELIKCCARETTKLLIEELDGGHFAILADESSDVYQNEQLVVCLRYVDKKGRAVVRLLGLAHVEDTTSLTLKVAIQQMLMEYNLTFTMARGQGYDGASNMKDEDASDFSREELIDALDLEEVQTGTGQNQEMGLGRPCDTRWGSHFRTVNRVLSLYGAIKRVLKNIGKEYHGAEAQAALSVETSILSFEFVFMAHLLQEIFGYTDDLSRALQTKDQDIVHAIELLDNTKFHLGCLRSDPGWDGFLQNVTSFYTKHKIKVLDMKARYYPIGRPRRGDLFNGVDNYHRFHVDMFVSVIDRQLSELNGRFDEVLRTEAFFPASPAAHPRCVVGASLPAPLAPPRRCSSPAATPRQIPTCRGSSLLAATAFVRRRRQLTARAPARRLSDDGPESHSPSMAAFLTSKLRPPPAGAVGATIRRLLVELAPPLRAPLVEPEPATALPSLRRVASAARYRLEYPRRQRLPDAELPVREHDIPPRHRHAPCCPRCRAPSNRAARPRLPRAQAPRRLILLHTRFRDHLCSGRCCCTPSLFFFFHVLQVTSL
uniref:Uncharacterized protein n=1 Tax=Avena sativa TaxID=4498 RepID=A0ACD5VTT1_AVESA